MTFTFPKRPAMPSKHRPYESVARLSIERLERRLICAALGVEFDSPDPYREKAAIEFGVSPAEVTPEQRQKVKMDFYRGIYSTASLPVTHGPVTTTGRVTTSGPPRTLTTP